MMKYRTFPFKDRLICLKKVFPVNYVFAWVSLSSDSVGSLSGKQWGNDNFMGEADW